MAHGFFRKHALPAAAELLVACKQAIRSAAAQQERRTSQGVHNDGGHPGVPVGAHPADALPGCGTRLPVQRDLNSPAALHQMQIRERPTSGLR